MSRRTATHFGCLRVPQVGVLADLCRNAARHPAQVSAYRDLWHPRRPSSANRRRRGVVLWDILIALGLVAVFLGATTQILRATMRLPYRANEMEALATRFDGVVEQLRRDVWGASGIVTDGQDGRSVRIERGTGMTPITWSIDDAGAISRRTDAETQSWADVAKGMTFQVEGGGVLVLVEPPDVRGEGRRIPVVSALSLSRQGRAS